MVNTTYIWTKDMIDKLQELKGKTNLKFYQNIGDQCDEMNIKTKSKTFQFGEDLFNKDVGGIGKIYEEVLFLIIFYKLNLKFKVWILTSMIYITLLLKIGMKRKL